MGAIFVKNATKLQPPDAWLLSFPQFHALYQFRVDGAEFGYGELGQGINNVPQLRSHIHRRAHALPPEFQFGFPLLESLDMSLNRLITLDHIGDWYPAGLKERQPAIFGRLLFGQIVLYVTPFRKHIFLSLGIPGFCVCGGIIKESLDRRQYVLPRPVCVVPVRTATIASRETSRARANFAMELNPISRRVPFRNFVMLLRGTWALSASCPWDRP